MPWPPNKPPYDTEKAITYSQWDRFFSVFSLMLDRCEVRCVLMAFVFWRVLGQAEKFIADLGDEVSLNSETFRLLFLSPFYGYPIRGYFDQVKVSGIYKYKILSRGSESYILMSQYSLWNRRASCRFQSLLLCGIPLYHVMAMPVRATQVIVVGYESHLCRQIEVTKMLINQLMKFLQLSKFQCSPSEKEMEAY